MPDQIARRNRIRNQVLLAAGIFCLIPLIVLAWPAGVAALVVWGGTVLVRHSARQRYQRDALARRQATWGF